MRTLLVILAVLGAASTAHADDTLPSETRAAYDRRPHLVLAFEGNDIGAGVRVGIAWRWVEVQGILEGNVFDSMRKAVALKVSPLPGLDFSPYVFGHLGTWADDIANDDLDSGSYRSVGGGFDARLSQRWYLYLEAGGGSRSGAHRNDANNGPFGEVHLGFNLRL